MIMKTLVQLSDPHIKAPGSLAYGRVDTAAYLARAVAAVMRLDPAPTAVVVSGDLCDFGRADEYAHLRSLLAPLACPVHLLPGNHDDRRELRRAFADHAYLQRPGDEAGWFDYAVDLGGLRLVVADTIVPGQSHGELCAGRLAALAARLDADASTPTIVAMHHPPFATGIRHMDAIGLLQGADALADLIRRRPQVEAIVCGHLHRSIQRRWAGTLALTSPSTAHQVCFDLRDEGPSAWALEPPGFMVHAWSYVPGIVSHVVPVGEFDGPHPFHAAGALID